MLLAALLDQRLDELARGDDHVVEHHVLLADAELAGLDSHALEQVVDEPREPLRAALQRRHELALRAVAHRPDAVAEQLDRRELRGERRAEFVRDVREHACRACGARPRAPSRRAAPALADPSAGAALEITTRRTLSSHGHDLLHGARRAHAPRLQDRARCSHGRRPCASRCGLSTSPQNMPVRLGGRDLEQRSACGFRNRIRRCSSTA